ncbi:DUF294 nucleotidyltransferase-like domain-containing protein [Nitrospina gracilis]|uniref:[protein-PII] uridylyltransferase family protein n=1 Tax=Nitrospina gracilis TaxID=35801 RepID=UPI001F02F628|nr:DUF294 nucleotidyltransferase-like domain-containing protein [Nitrospina gracilis]MCF8719691.1 [protein-PII] uridylyltransferase [Nitrospina gracilis Nb-211]
MLELYQTNRKQAREYRESLVSQLDQLTDPRDLPSIQDNNPQPFYLEFKKKLTQFVQKETELLQKELQQSENSHLLLLKRTALVDAVVQVAFARAVWMCNRERAEPWGNNDFPVAVIARGGYGREEMYFHSDVDMQIVVRTGATEEQKERGYQLITFFDYLLVYQDIFPTAASTGHSEIDTENLDLKESELAAFHSLLEHRMVAGNPLVYREFTSSIKTASLIHKDKIIEHCFQYKNYFEVPNTVFRQEPNLKEELRRLYWALSLVRIREGYQNINQFELLVELYNAGKLSTAAFKNMKKALNFVSRMRLFLHCHQKGAHRDVLSYEVREIIAESMGYAGKVREFFQEYFFNAVLPMKRFSRNLFWDGVTPSTEKMRRLSPDFALNSESQIVLQEGKEDVTWDSPLPILELFVWVSRKNYFLSYPVVRAIERHADQMMPMFQSGADQARIQQLFHAILRGKHFARALRYLHEFRLLENFFIPEFKNLSGLLQDIYVHLFPTDIHVLAALDALNRLDIDPEADPFLTELYHSLKDKAGMRLSVLLHDIGKGLKTEGENEELVGSRAVPHILEKLGFGKNQKMIRDIAFLVEKHLMMRDLMLLDPDDDTTYEMIWDLVEKNVERLKMLILLTYADRAGTKMKMTQTQIDQLKYFYQFTLQFKKRESVSIPVKQEFLKMIRLPRDLQSQLQIYDQFKKSREGFATELFYKPEHPAELVVCTRDQRGLLYKIAAVLAFNHLSIIEANVHTLDNNVFDIFKVVSATGEPIDFSNFFFIQKQVIEDLRRVFVGNLDIASLYRGRPLTSSHEASKYKDIKLKVSIIGRTVKVETHDILGTMMMETKVFSDLNMKIDRAVIHTTLENASNVFYVRPEDVRKIMQEEDKFKTQLKNALRPLIEIKPIFPNEPAEVA